MQRRLIIQAGAGAISALILATYQQAHALLAMQLGWHWPHTLAPDRWVGLLAAIAQHDDEQEPEPEADTVDDFYVDGEVPPDYRLTLQDESGVRVADFEAVILATGRGSTDPGSAKSIAGYDELVGEPYLFRIGLKTEGNDEGRLQRGWREIVAIYASLGGRRSLDLYHPSRPE